MGTPLTYSCNKYSYYYYLVVEDEQLRIWEHPTYSCNKYYYYYYLVVEDEQLRIWEHPSPTAVINIIIIII